MTSPQHSPEAFAAGTGTGQATFEFPAAANLTVKQALKVLNVSRTTLYRSWLEGWGPEFFWVGRSRRVPLQAALAWRGRPAEVAGGEV